MASIRKTKKNIRYACGEIASELLVASSAINDFNHEETPKIIGDIAALQVDALSKCTFAYDKAKSDFENAKAYRQAKHKYVAAAFKKLHDETSVKMQTIVDRMNDAMPQHIKDALKTK